MNIIYNNKNVIMPDAAPVKKINPPAIQQGKASFQDVLSAKIDEQTPLQFSKHASTRLSSRDITLSQEQMQRVEDGVHKAREKGINDSLVLVDDVALVVNVKNKVVITAINRNTENVFSNIDGAVIV